tara:strand:- start:1647 stop:2426 length:780 start_codon:yes stop_codon:yes gene_type:complete
MDIHIGSSSYLSKNLRKLNKTINLSSKKKFKYKLKKFNSKVINKLKFNFIFVFLGKNFKNKNTKQSELINYKLPLKFLKEFLKTEKKIKIIFFGSFSQYDKKHGVNHQYISQKSRLRKKIINLKKKNKNFEYAWIYLPNIYGLSQNNEFLIPNLILNMKQNHSIKIKNGLKKIYLLNVEDFVKMISYIKNNWNKYKNKSLVSIYEGPYLLREIINIINKKYLNSENIKINYKSLNERKINSTIGINKKNKFSSFLKNVK